MRGSMNEGRIDDEDEDERGNSDTKLTTEDLSTGFPYKLSSDFFFFFLFAFSVTSVFLNKDLQDRRCST